MRFIRKLMIGLAAVAAVPLVAQGPVAAPPAKKAEAVAAPAVKATATPATLDRADLEAWLDGYLPYALERGRIPGAVVVVVKDGQVVLEKGYGYSDVAKRAPVLPETTLFRPGSVSKLFTWTAVMQQVEAGKIDLDADINTYLDSSMGHAYVVAEGCEEALVLGVCSSADDGLMDSLMSLHGEGEGGL